MQSTPGKLLALTIIECCLLSAASVADERRYTLLEREIEYLIEIWPGDYDNREQVQFDANVGRDSVDDGAHLRLHSQISRVALPDFGEYMLYVEEYRDNDATDIFRQRLYELIADEDEAAIRVRMHFFHDGRRWTGAHENARILAELTPRDTYVIEGCDMLLRRDADALAGGMQPGNCAIDNGEARRFSDYQVRVTETAYWFRGNAISADGSEAFKGMEDLSWHQLERARWFRCMVDFPRKEGGRPVNTIDYVRIHDQGGTYPFTYRDGREMVLTLRNNWSYGMQRESLVVVVQEEDETGPTLVYGWTQPGADRIGVNPGWIRLQCDLDTPRMRKFQQWLRPDS